MKIEWNRVTWYSKLAAVVVFLATFAVAFYLGAFYEQVRIGPTVAPAPRTAPPQTGGGAGAHCGGFIRNAPTCAAGFHCQLKVSSPDTGGICVAD